MKILRPLPPAVYGEWRQEGDVYQALEGELLVSAPCPCPKALHDARCVCARAFVGAKTGCAVTLATVAQADESTAFAEFVDSPAALYWWGNDGSQAAAEHLWNIGLALERFALGDILRLKWTSNGAAIYRAPVFDEQAVMAELRGGAADDIQ